MTHNEHLSATTTASSKKELGSVTANLVTLFDKEPLAPAVNTDWMTEYPALDT